MSVGSFIAVLLQSMMGIQLYRRNLSGSADTTPDKLSLLTVELVPGLGGVSEHEINPTARLPVFNHHPREKAPLSQGTSNVKPPAAPISSGA